MVNNEGGGAKVRGGGNNICMAIHTTHRTKAVQPSTVSKKKMHRVNGWVGIMLA